MQPAPSSVAIKLNGDYVVLVIGIKIYMDSLPKRTCNHFLKTIYITRNIKLQNFQGGGSLHLLQPATCSKKQPSPKTTRTLK
jgi:hypothetical protein